MNGNTTTKDTIQNLQNNNNIQINNDNNQKDFNNEKLLLNNVIHFKNDILKEIKALDIKINIQNNANNEINKKLVSYYSKLEDLTRKIDNFSSIINKTSGESNYYTQKINTLFEFKSKIEKDTISQNCKLKMTAEELKDAINKYDRLISNNILYPGVIGIDSKFKDYHEFIDYVLQQLKNFSLFKEKNIFDLKLYKNKLETNIKSLNVQIQSLLNNANTYALKNIKDTEEKFLNEIKLYDEKLVELRVENSEFVRKLEIQNKETLKEWNNILKIKKDITELVETTVEKIKLSNSNIQNLFENYQEQINDIKNNYILLLNTTKGVKDKNIDLSKPLLKIQKKEEIKASSQVNQEIKNEIKNNIENEQEPRLKNEENISTKIKNKKLQNIKSAESILKNYIQGKSTLEELIEKNTKKHHKENKKYYDNGPFSIVTLVSFKNAYDENNEQKNIYNRNIYNTIDENRTNFQSNIPFLDKRKINKSNNISPKLTNQNSKRKSEKNKIDLDCQVDNYFRKIRQNTNNKIKRDNNKKLLLKDGEFIIINNYKNKSNENEKKNIKTNKDIENFINKNKNANIKYLDDISFLVEDKKNNNSNKFPKLENNKQIDIYGNIDKKNKNGRRYSKKYNNKIEDYYFISSIKRKKNKNKTSISSELINQNYNNKNDKNNKSNHMNHSLSNENFIESYQNINDITKKKDIKKDLILKGNYLNSKEKNK